MAVYEVLLSKATRKQLASLPAFIHNKIIEEDKILRILVIAVGHRRDIYE